MVHWSSEEASKHQLRLHVAENCAKVRALHYIKVKKNISKNSAEGNRSKLLKKPKDHPPAAAQHETFASLCRKRASVRIKREKEELKRKTEEEERAACKRWYFDPNSRINPPPAISLSKARSHLYFRTKKSQEEVKQHEKEWEEKQKWKKTFK